MPTNLIQFPLTDAASNPLVGSLATLRIYATLDNSGSNVPVQVYSDNNGTASFSNVLTGFYRFTWTPAGANNPATYTNGTQGLAYLAVPTLNDTQSNGFNYQILQNIPPNVVNGTPQNLGTDIAGMSNYIRNTINDWAMQEQGVCFIAEDDGEKINIGFNNCVGPRCLLVFTGETPYGDESVAELVCWVKRDYDLVVQRGKILSDPRNTALTKTTGPSRAFYTLMEEARDVVRAIELPTPMCYNPVIYNGTRTGEQNGWLMDSYIISFSILVQIPRIQYQAPEISGDGPFVNLVDPGQWLQNTTP